MKEDIALTIDYEDNNEAIPCIDYARMIEYLRAVGLSDTQICDCFIYIASGVGLPTKGANLGI